MRNRDKWARRLYGDEPDYPAFEGRRYRIDRLMRQRKLRLCDRCMHHRCYDTSGQRHARSKPRSWKRNRRTAYHPIGEHSSTVNPELSET